MPTSTGGNYFQQVVNKLRIDPPAKFTGSEDYDAFYKRFRNYISMTDRNYGKIFDYITRNVKAPVTDEVLALTHDHCSEDRVIVSMTANVTEDMTL